MGEQIRVSSSKQVGRLTQDEFVLYRGRMVIDPATQGPMSIYAPYYFGQGSKDIEFLNIENLIPEIEVYMTNVLDEEFPEYETFIKCPTSNVGDLGSVNYVVRCSIGFGVSKAVGTTVSVDIRYWNENQNDARTFFYTIKAKLAGTVDGSLFTDDGSF